ncbi:23S rRNA (guanosine(2251)-2'-O)-methyltransferase RlmB [Leucobacter luti]|uniref:23S rRNA (Guanosine2251-2'-O)-methyltransferase n=1 Tax=Leucobacter luti TaxID=340320 RepID=A0A4R6S6W0_9MICO|nr:23S rRNA (guanosine(2251)-2'-O)-methyltransferase RlmB [Leucobacter luti]MCW2288843.1 23S rRNA (guanosine2251-2'-O)-methyltransferase [Leucobacter luti]QYM75259.1 23S rRNA (guanosine(2251)-2'-O)-methyltransferase RlmB [Leucobacter luti]TCK45006.1 23S rRNA (guanosine2251-2'-O)-methyltransferase [Leucobacter luti]TDP95530.1 23S rRNA (guanosine2251-2'-O)-methyltransferase [Leucobacter luti]
MTNKKSRTGAIRKKGLGKAVGSGGQGRQALEGRGPTPKAEEREYHAKYKAKKSRERYDAAKARYAERTGQTPDRGRGGNSGGGRKKDESELVTGRNAVVEALRAQIPASTLYIASRVEMDDRMREILRLATNRNVPVLEVMRQELDRMTERDTVHQGVVLKVPPMAYAHPMEMLDQIIDRDELPLIVALDGVTDPRNLGAIIRSVGAFGGQGVVVPQRRSAGLNSASWKTSAGAAARIPVAMASNLTQTIKEYKKQGVFIVGLDGDGDVSLPGLELADRPLMIVIGSEGKGLSRLVTETCDAVVSIPISAVTESLNAGIAASVALYEVSRLRAAGTAPAE